MTINKMPPRPTLTQTDRYARLREALAMGPTRGPRVIRQDPIQAGTEWYMLTGDSHYRVLANVPIESERDRADADFLAACDADTIRELLEERDALAAKVASYERAERDINEALNMGNGSYLP